MAPLCTAATGSVVARLIRAPECTRPSPAVQIIAALSVVALSDGEFAVTTLTSRRLVEVMDEKGNLVRSFGDPTDVDRGRSSGGTISDQTTPQGSMLEFFGSGTDNTDEYTSQALAYTGEGSGLQGGISAEPYEGTGIDQNLGLPTAFIYGTMFGGGMRFDHPNLEGSGAKGPDAGAHFGEARFGPHGRFGPGEANLTATVRINLGYLGEKSDDKPAITATGVDPSTGELWAGIGNALIHFSQDGNPIEICYRTMNGGVPLKPSALLIEPDRFLIAADPWGIFEFDRPK